MGLPYHRSFTEDIADLPSGEPVELVFDLLPTSNVFDVGHHIRVSITCADKGNTSTPVLSPSPTVNIYRNADYASHIVLPFIPTDPDEAELLTNSKGTALLTVPIIVVSLVIVAVFVVMLTQKPS